MADQPELECPACGEPVFPDDHFCEACGSVLALAMGTGEPIARARTERAADATTCPGCGAAPEEALPEGFCGVCGRQWSPLREHDELTDGPLAGITDRGTDHWRNEDAVGLWSAEEEAAGGFVMVVCDGVSSSQHPHDTSQAAVDAALPVLAEAVSAGSDLEAAMVDATAAAQKAAAAVPFDADAAVGPGSCTYVAVAMRDGLAVFGSVGDSRAYWIDGAGAEQVGRDDSVAAQLVAEGRSTEQAMASPHAHAITKWLGADATDAAPTITKLDLSGPGIVLLASDGLWNCTPKPQGLAKLVGPIPDQSPLDLARRLSAYAERVAGDDNITVAIAPIP